MKYEKYLPIGTVVMLKGGQKRMMITGFLCSDGQDDKVYDYCGCLYPEGVIAADKTLLFNHDQIETVFYLGLRDEEETKFKEKLKEVVNIINKKNNQTNIND